MSSFVPEQVAGEPTPYVRERGTRRESSVLRLPVQPAAEEPPVDLDLLVAHAGELVCDVWEREVGDGFARGDLAPHVAALCEMVGRCARGEECAPCAFPPAVPVRRILDRLRGTLLDQLAVTEARVDPAALVCVLRGIELASALVDRDAAQRFASRLAGPDGLELLVDVAHDLRSPLTSILFLAETLHGKRSGPINAVQERQLGLIYSAALALSAITNDVIELARGGDRLLDQTPVPFSVTDTMQSVLDVVRPMAEEKGLEIRVRAPESADSRVGQPTALGRVLLNLTTNALKFTDSGYVELSATSLSRTRLEFSVRDTGRGLSPDVLAVLFEPFRRRYRPGEYTFSSSGLGLAICRKLVVGMGSELECESMPEQGTRFHFALELPLTPKL
ncbi:MAG TPA: HAMP domain-containing sensor histidine kinase [Gemmatimonadaceae bacterium]|nr:HAMP domain-containing sensor histidine kinase [Gemmatimonadaceae bacterium]